MLCKTAVNEVSLVLPASIDATMVTYLSIETDKAAQEATHRLKWRLARYGYARLPYIGISIMVFTEHQDRYQERGVKATTFGSKFTGKRQENLESGLLQDLTTALTTMVFNLENFAHPIVTETRG